MDVSPGVTARAARLVAERPLVAGVLRALQRYLAIDGTQRGLVLAGQAFSALIPLLIVLSTVVSSNGGEHLAERINARFRLAGNGADAVRTLFAQPAGAAQSVTIGSAILLVVSGLSCARTMQRTYEAAWRLPPRGLRGTIGGAGALALLLTQILLLSLLSGFLRQVPAGSVLELATRAAASSALWLALQHLLLGGRVAWRRLLPGAVVAGVGQQGVAALSTLWIPGVVQSNASRYGAIGVSFALLSWLVLISVVLVIAAAVSVELGDGPALPQPAPGHGRGLLSTLARLLGADDLPAEERAGSSPGRGGTAGPAPGGPAPGGAAPADGPDLDPRRPGHEAASTPELVVLGFPTREKAEALLEISRDRRSEDLLDLADAALVWRTADEQITVQHSYGRLTGGTPGGLPWDALLGLLFLMPAFGLTVGGPNPGGARTLTDVGLDDAFVTQVAGTVTPGAAAVFVLVRHGTPDHLQAALLPDRPSVLRTRLSVQDEAELAGVLQQLQSQVAGAGWARDRGITPPG